MRDSSRDGSRTCNLSRHFITPKERRQKLSGRPFQLSVCFALSSLFSSLCVCVLYTVVGLSPCAIAWIKIMLFMLIAPREDAVRGCVFCCRGSLIFGLVEGCVYEITVSSALRYFGFIIAPTSSLSWGWSLQPPHVCVQLRIVGKCVQCVDFFFLRTALTRVNNHTRGSRGYNDTSHKAKVCI